MSEFLPFDFTSLVVLDPIGSSLNPLGLLTTQTRLSRQLFPQFTVLTNEPRNHALLCGILSYLTQHNYRVESREIRKAEALWGIAQTFRVKTEGGNKPLNVRRYEIILEQFSSSKKVELDDVITSKFGLMNRLGYGVWGFYARPSQVWRILNASTRKLSDAGMSLGQSFNEETGFSSLLDKWFSGKPISLNQALLDFAQVSRLTADQLGRSEKAQWRSLYNSFRSRAAKSKDVQMDQIWDLLPTVEKIDRWSEESAYPKFFSKFIKKDAAASRLHGVVEAQYRFERTAAWIEFAFESMYLFAQENEDLEPLSPKDWELIVTETRLEADLYEQVRSDFSPRNLLFAELSQTRTIESYRSKLLEIHNSVQKAKGKSPYLDLSGRLLQYGAMNCERAIAVFSNKASSGQLNPDHLRFVFRRDWHYRKAAKYKESFE